MRTLTPLFWKVIRWLCTGLLFTRLASGQVGQEAEIHIDANAPTSAFPHFWEKTFGSGRAILTLRESYRKDLQAVKDATDFESVRFHGIFMDEVGLYNPGRILKNPGLEAEKIYEASTYNFMYIDQIYDGLLEKHIKPFVELSFMPRKMASDPDELHPFFYHPVVSPPKDYKEWDEMIRAFAAHLIARYGIEEVSTWKFEVWNEPNIDFWAGKPKKSTYWTLYDHTARALKTVSPRLQIGGPATAQAAWIPEFLAHAHLDNVPIDFVSTHVYANDTAPNVLGTGEDVPRDQMVFRAVKKVHDQIAASAFPNLPLIFSEYGASYSNEPNITDSAYMGPWLANTILQCDQLVDTMAYWTFSDVFEEQGPAFISFYGGFGLIAPNNIPKPSFNAFAALHHLGDRRIPVVSDSVLATKRKEGGLAIALWNYVPPARTGPTYTRVASSPEPSRNFVLQLDHWAMKGSATLLRVDENHGSCLRLFDEMGRPENLTKDQIQKLQKAGAMAPSEQLPFKKGQLSVNVPPNGLVVLLIAPAKK